MGTIIALLLYVLSLFAGWRLISFSYDDDEKQKARDKNMGAKSTVKLTREQALERLLEYKVRDYAWRLRRNFDAYKAWTNEAIEDELEFLNDQHYIGMITGCEAGFDNYLIVDNDVDD